MQSISTVVSNSLFAVFSRCYSQATPPTILVMKHGLSFHHYADALQWYGTFKFRSTSLTMTFNRLQTCIAELQVWIKENQMTKHNLFPNETNIGTYSSISMGKNIINALLTVTNHKGCSGI